MFWYIWEVAPTLFLGRCYIKNRNKNHFGNQPYHRQCTHHPPSIPLKSLSISNWKPLRHTHFHAQWRICWAISLSIIWYHDISLVVEFGVGDFPWMLDDTHFHKSKNMPELQNVRWGNTLHQLKLQPFGFLLGAGQTAWYSTWLSSMQTERLQFCD